MRAAVGVVELALICTGGAQEKLTGVSRRRIGEGTSATLELCGSDVPWSLIGKGTRSEGASFCSLPLVPPNNCRATEGGTEPISTSNLDCASSADSVSIGAAAIAAISTGTSGDGAVGSLGVDSVVGGHLGANEVLATTVM